MHDLAFSQALDLWFKWRIDDTLSGRDGARRMVRDLINPPPPPDPATWGLSPDAIAGQQTAMAQWGPG